MKDVLHNCVTIFFLCNSPQLTEKNRPIWDADPFSSSLSWSEHRTGRNNDSEGRNIPIAIENPMNSSGYMGIRQSISHKKNNSRKATMTNVFPYMSHTIENTLAIPPLLSPKTALAYTKTLANITKFSRPHQTTHKCRPKVKRLAQGKCSLLYRIFGNIRENRKSTPKILYNPTTYLPHQSAFLWNIQLYVGSPQTGQ